MQVQFFFVLPHVDHMPCYGGVIHSYDDGTFNRKPFCIHHQNWSRLQSLLKLTVDIFLLA